jgi:hypothetical protein
MNIRQLNTRLERIRHTEKLEKFIVVAREYAVMQPMRIDIDRAYLNLANRAEEKLAELTGAELNPNRVIPSNIIGRVTSTVPPELLLQSVSLKNIVIDNRNVQTNNPITPKNNGVRKIRFMKGE